MLKITKVKSGKKGPDTIEKGSNKKNKPKKYFLNILIFNYFDFFFDCKLLVNYKLIK